MTRLARVLDSDMRELRRLHPTQQSVDDRVTPLSTASLTLPEGEHAAFHDWVEVFNQNGSAGVYRVSGASETYTDEASVETRSFPERERSAARCRMCFPRCWAIRL